MQAKEDLLIIDKVYDLVVWSCRHIAQFPRTHRFTLGDRIANRLYHILERLVFAKYNQDRLATLQDVNLELELLRIQFRLARDLNCLSVDSYGFGTRTVNEIGRLVGGWIKHSRSRHGARHKEASPPTTRGGSTR